jgi:hypothetical protein
MQPQKSPPVLAQNFPIFRLKVVFGNRESLSGSFIRLTRSIDFIEQCGIALQGGEFAVVRAQSLPNIRAYRGINSSLWVAKSG